MSLVLGNDRPFLPAAFSGAAFHEEPCTPFGRFLHVPLRKVTGHCLEILTPCRAGWDRHRRGRVGSPRSPAATTRPPGADPRPRASPPADPTGRGDKRGSLPGGGAQFWGAKSPVPPPPVPQAGGRWRPLGATLAQGWGSAGLSAARVPLSETESGGSSLFSEKEATSACFPAPPARRRSPSTRPGVRGRRWHRGTCAAFPGRQTNGLPGALGKGLEQLLPARARQECVQRAGRLEPRFLRVPGIVGMLQRLTPAPGGGRQGPGSTASAARARLRHPGGFGALGTACRRGGVQ